MGLLRQGRGAALLVKIQLDQLQQVRAGRAVDNVAAVGHPDLPAPGARRKEVADLGGGPGAGERHDGHAQPLGYKAQGGVEVVDLAQDAGLDAVCGEHFVLDLADGGAPAGEDEPAGGEYEKQRGG